MTCFLIEIPVPQQDGVDLWRAMRSLRVAESRLCAAAVSIRTLIFGVVEDEGRMVCLVEAPTADAVRRLLGLAFLPAGRIREVSALDLADSRGVPGPGGQDPRRDLGSGIDSQLVQDVVEMGLHGSLGDE